MIEDAGTGVFLYVLPGRGRLVDDLVAAGARVQVTATPEQAAPGPDVAPTATSSTPLRDFGLGAQVLAHLGVRTLRLLTNNPRRIAGLEGYGLHVVECVPWRPPAVILPLREEETP
jgi:3,4-dihydroxy 2-butanone 4-phosphate synthase/GTP cyclohydrolase II